MCSICHKISATDQDHLDCIQKIRIEFDDENFKQSILENLNLTKNSQNLGIEIKAVLEHLTKEKKDSDQS
jgi:mannitol/fructose-specific phosphotransferase system IIA component